MTISIQTEGRRSYIVGNTYAVREKIKALGAHWDGQRKAWWTAKADEAAQLVAALNAAAPAAPSNSVERPNNTPRDGVNSVVAGRATYKGKSYYVAGRVQRGSTRYTDSTTGVQTADGSKLLLYFRDGSSQFWAPAAAVQIVKRYDRPQTIRGLKQFAEQAKRDEADGVDNSWIGNGCSECRRIGTWCSHCAFDEFDN